jgi:hypothetical protein
MPLRKSPILTPARLAANRRSALQSTEPRTAAGKAWSRLNGLRSGSRSLAYQRFLRALLDAPPGEIERVASTALTPQQAAHPLFARTVDSFRRAEFEICCDFRHTRLEVESQKKRNSGGGKVTSEA